MDYNRYSFIAPDEQSAENLIAELRRIVIDYGCVTVEDLKDALGLDIDDNDSSIGWINIPEAQIDTNTNLNNGQVVVHLPHPIPLGPNANPKETVDHPNHYQSETGLEAWDVIEAFTFDLKGVEAFDTGNILKYICRWKRKNGLEDLKKAKRYLEHLIDHVEKIEKENDQS